MPASARSLKPPCVAPHAVPLTVSCIASSGYRQEVADDAWKQLQAWFKKYGVLN